MGLMRFLVAPADRMTSEAAARAYMVGLEESPWLCQARYDDGLLVIRREQSESGVVWVPWRVPGFGELAIPTGTLVERERPYLLAVELARGKISQVRNQLADWESVGLTVKSPVRETLHEAIERFARAATSQQRPEEASAEAEMALVKACEAAQHLAHRYVEKALYVRQRSGAPLGTRLGACLGAKRLRLAQVRQFLKAFNSAQTPLVWRSVESSEGNYRWRPFDRAIDWCKAQSLSVVAGPVLRLDDRGMPDWLALWERDFDNVVSFVNDYVETVVHRYAGRVDMWICAARVNGDPVLGFEEEHMLRLAVHAYEVTRRIDPATPVIIQFSEPWAEYMGRRAHDLSPLHFADVLVRSGLQMGGVGLEINFGYSPGGTYLRDLIDLSRQVDRWTMLGMPLWITLTAPGGVGPDAQAVGRAKLIDNAWEANGPDVAWQRAFLKDVASMLLAKPIVAGVFLGNVLDAVEHEFPHSGLFDAAGAAKPALGSLAKLRATYLDPPAGQQT